MARTKEEIMSALTRLKDYSRYFVDAKNGERIELDGIQELCDETIKLIKSQPDVVRCMNCKYYAGITKQCFMLNNPTSDDYWCADGKRREQTDG